MLIHVLLASFALHSASAIPKLLPPMLDDRIVGGVSVTIEEYPYQVVLLYRDTYICGGSIIGATWIVTAAHCTDWTEESELAIRAGSSEYSSGGVVIPVKKLHQNENYDPWSLDYDISLLELVAPLEFTASIAPVPLPEQDQHVPEGANAVVTGWGRLAETGSVSPLQLQMVQVPIMSMEECRKAYGANSITDRMICAGYYGVGGKDACQGDSGGPLVVDGQLIGVVSWGYGCARPEFPGVYTSIPVLRGYIAEVSGL